MADCFAEKNLDIATVTETWFQTNRERAELVAEFGPRFSLGMITRERDRAANNGRQYGGLAIIYRLKTTKLDEFVLDNPAGYKVLAAFGKVTGIKGKLFVLACYAPPNLSAAQAEGLIQYLSDVVCEAKRTYRDCSILITGDFNQWSIKELLDDHPDLSEIEHGPTRGKRSIDRSLCNFGRSVIESGTLPPLETENGQVSDHLMAYAVAKFETPVEETITYSYRPFTERGAEQFLQAIRSQSWESIAMLTDVNEKRELFQGVVDRAFNDAFPLKTTTKRKSDPPWVNDLIQRLSLKRRKIYDKHGRSKR